MKATRPYHTPNDSRSSRALTRLWRAQAAYDMAKMRFPEGPTIEQVDAAADLLNRCTRWALAQMRHNEGETSTNFKQYWYVHEGDLLYARMERLEAELRPYGCGIACCGYFHEDVYPMDFERHVITGNGLLHFFEY